MTDLAQLIAKLEAASEGSRELDIDIAIASGEWTPPYGAERDADRPDVWRRSGVNYWAQYAAYTTSIDAVVALIELKLPGWYRGLQQNRHAPYPDDFSFWLEPPTRRSDAYFEGRGKTDAIAGCGAFLRALQAQQETSEDE